MRAEMCTHTCSEMHTYKTIVIPRLTQRYTQAQARTHMNTGSTCARTHKDTYAYPQTLTRGSTYTGWEHASTYTHADTLPETHS